MALAYALQAIEAGDQARLTIYGEFLEQHPPTHEAEIHQASSWSCAHGVDRWRKHCGCNSGGHPGWNQHWREPLRRALDWLRDQLAPRFEAKAGEFLKDPWLARDDYITVILDRSPENTARFFARHAGRPMGPADQVTALRLLEMQRHALLMYTSCGWFFDEISGLETVQIIQYAARAIQLAQDLLGDPLEPAFLDILGQARSNLREHPDARHVYEQFVKPAIMTRESAGAHYAISSLFESYPEEARIYSFTVRQEDRQMFSAGNARLALGRVNVTFEVTRNADLLTYAVVHMGDHNLNCGVRFDGKPEAYAALARELRAAFEGADFPELIRLMDHHFGATHYSLKNLFRDEQHKVLNQILAATRDEIHNTYRLITDRYAPLMRFLAELRAPTLKPLSLATGFVLNSELRRQFEGDSLDLQRVRTLLGECEATKTSLDGNTLAYALKRHIDRLSDQLLESPQAPELLQRFTEAADLARNLPFEVNLWKPQNAYAGMRASVVPGLLQRAEAGDETAKAWLEKFLVLGERLGFRVDRNSH